MCPNDACHQLQLFCSLCRNIEPTIPIKTYFKGDSFLLRLRLEMADSPAPDVTTSQESQPSQEIPTPSETPPPTSVPSSAAATDAAARKNATQPSVNPPSSSGEPKSSEKDENKMIAAVATGAVVVIGVAVALFLRLRKCDDEPDEVEAPKDVVKQIRGWANDVADRAGGVANRAGDAAGRFGDKVDAGLSKSATTTRPSDFARSQSM